MLKEVCVPSNANLQQWLEKATFEQTKLVDATNQHVSYLPVIQSHGFNHLDTLK